MYTANYFIDKLKLKEHPEGGYYNECIITDNTFDSSCLEGLSGERKLWQSIYYLLKDRGISALHRLNSDEIWYYHSGSPLVIYIFDKDENLVQKKLGLDVERGEMPQVIIHRGEIFGAAMDGTGYSLVGCMTSPGFRFEDYELMDRTEMIKKYPQYEQIIKRLTK